MTVGTDIQNTSAQPAAEEAMFLADFATQTPVAAEAKGGVFVGTDFRSIDQLTKEAQYSGSSFQPMPAGGVYPQPQAPVVIQNFSVPSPAIQPQVTNPSPAQLPVETLNAPAPEQPKADASSTQKSVPGELNNNPSLLERLASKYTPEQLSTMTVAQLLADVMSSSDILGPWQEVKVNGKTRLSGSFLFDSFNDGNAFLRTCMYCFEESGHDPSKVAIETNSDGKWNVVIETFSVDQENISRKDVMAANYANYVYQMSMLRKENRKSDPYFYDYYCDKENVDEKLSAAVELSPDEIQKFSLTLTNSGLPYQVYSETNSDGDLSKLMLKVPVAKLGEWPHPLYKKVSFTQSDFDEMIQNFSDNVLGFEPPLFLGHPNDYLTTEGAPAEAFLEKLSQEDDVFFGHYEVVDEETYADVKKGKFRYASAEIIRNHTSKKSNQNVGTVLFGHALTNRPFIPDLPRVQALADTPTAVKDSPEPQRIYVPICLSMQETEMVTQQNGNSQQTEFAGTGNETQPPASVSPQTITSENLSMSTQTPPVESQSTEALANSDSEKRILAVVNAMEQRFSSELTALKAETNAARQEAEEAKAQLRQKEIEEKLSHIDSLALPAETKEEYSSLIREGSLGSAEAQVIESLSSLSLKFGEALKTQHGVAPETEREELSAENPYEQTISRNKEAAAAAKSA